MIAYHLGNVVKLELQLMHHRAKISQGNFNGAQERAQLENEIKELKLEQVRAQERANTQVSASICVRAVNTFKDHKEYVELCLKHYEEEDYSDDEAN